MADLRDRGVITEAEFQSQKADCWAGRTVAGGAAALSMAAGAGRIVPLR